MTINEELKKARKVFDAESFGEMVENVFQVHHC